MVVGEEHMVGPNCQQYNWQSGMRHSMAAHLRKYPHMEKSSRNNLEEKLRVERLKAVYVNPGLSPAALIEKGNPLRIKPVWCPRAGLSRQNGLR